MVLAAFGASGRAQACSMVSGYKVPTNLELAAAADTIVIARVVGERKSEKKYDGVVLLEPIALLKGAVLPKSVEIERAYLSTDPRMVIASNPRELRHPNPGALIGGCVRYTFLPNARLLLFLHRDEKGKLVPYRSAFSRDAEDVPDDMSLWESAVREYATISLLPKRDRKAALLRRASQLEALGGDDALAIAHDLRVEAAGKRLPPYD
jgi:hypothetical protein